jgi:hypothetical protein
VIAARWKSLPKGRVFAFDLIHLAAVAALVDADTPRAIQVTNPTKEPIRIGKYTRLGQIRDNEGTDYSALCDWRRPGRRSRDRLIDWKFGYSCWK